MPSSERNQAQSESLRTQGNAAYKAKRSVSEMPREEANPGRLFERLTNIPLSRSVDRYKDAVELYALAIVADPSSAFAYGNRAAALYMLDDYDAALLDSELAIARDSSQAKNYLRSVVLR